MVTYAILLGGRVTPCARLCHQLRKARFIAADSGMRHAAPLGARIELWVGDFDSANHKLMRAFSYVTRKAHPTNKDASDGELALREAQQRGADKIIMVGGLGGEHDHTLMHFSQMLSLSGRGTATHITNGLEEAWPLLPGRTHLNMPAGTRISVIGFEDLHHLSLSNVHWPLNRQNIFLGSTLTLANKSLGDVEILLEQGRGIIMLSFPRK